MLCLGQRQGSVQATPRTQSSIAVSSDGNSWVLLNASPDIGQQIRQQPQLQPQPHQGLRHSPIQAVVLLDAQIDHVSGLLSLREGPPIHLYATPCVLEELATGFPLRKLLAHYCGIEPHAVPVAGTQSRADFQIDGIAGLRFTALAIPGKAPPYSPHRQTQVLGDNIALRIEDLHNGKRLFYAPGLAQVGPQERQWMADADCLLVDGTFWSHDEMQRAGLGHKTAADMGHLPQSEGMLEALTTLPTRADQRQLLIHINNSNPILDAASPQRRLLDAQGIKVAYDGMEINL